MNYLILTESELSTVVGKYQEGTITREITGARLLKNGKYALDMVLLNSTSEELINKLSNFSVEDVSETDFQPIIIRI